MFLNFQCQIAMLIKGFVALSFTMIEYDLSMNEFDVALQHPS